MRELLSDGRIGLAFQGLSLRGEVRHVFTTRDREGGGNVSLSGGRDREAALAERRLWSERLEVSPQDWTVGGQVHGRTVAVVGEAERGRGAMSPEDVLPETDGLVTVTPGLPLYVAVADCAGVLLLAPGERPVLGLVHAGWRGLRAGILEKAVAQVCAQSGREPAGLLAGVTPCIGWTHYEVGEEVAEPAPDARRVRLEGRWHVDIAGWANDQLRGAGLPAGSVEVSGLDTYERADLFFSHRRDGAETGRMGLLAVLAEPTGGPAPQEGLAG